MATGLEMSLSGSYKIDRKTLLEVEDTKVFDKVEEHIREVSKNYKTPMTMSYIDTGDSVIFRWFPSE